MKIKVIDPPRPFQVGRNAPVELKDCAHITLEPDEQVTFVTPSGAEYDVTRKSWGFYATPSLNGRLKRFGLRGVLVKSPDGKYYVFLVEKGFEDGFRRYVDVERHEVICWLDEEASLERFEKGSVGKK